MKESITKFDLEAAFKALDDIDTPVAEKGIKANKPALTEIFSRKSKFDSLFEEYYDIGNSEELSDAKEAREAEVAKAKLARIEKIVDLDAESPDDLLTSYVGKFIIQCPQCMTLFYKNPEDVEESEDDPTTVNVNEVCQHCGNESGYTLVGKVGEATAEEELPADTELEPMDTEVPADDETSEESSEEESNSEDMEAELDDFDLDSELEELDLEIEDDEEEKKEESFFQPNENTGLLVEQLTEGADLDVSADEFKQLIDSPEFKKPISDRSARAMMQEFEESVKTKDSEVDLLAAFNDCNYEVIEADYTKSDDIIISLNHNVSDIDEAAEHLKKCLEQAGIGPILDWNTNGHNVFIFSVGSSQVSEEITTDLNESSEDFEDYQLVFEPTEDVKNEDLTNTLCDTVSKIGVKYHSAKKLANKYYINILGSEKDLQAAKITIENSGFFKSWLKDTQLASSYDAEENLETLEEGGLLDLGKAIGKKISQKGKDLKNKISDSIDRMTDKAKTREEKADWVLNNALEDYNKIKINNKNELAPDESNRRFGTYIILCFKDSYSNGKLITMAPSFNSIRDLVMGEQGVQVKDNYKDADSIAKGWSMKQGCGPAFIYLAKDKNDAKAVFLCEYFKGDLEYDQLEKYVEVVKKDLEAGKLMDIGGMDNDTADQNTEAAQELAASEIKQGMKIKVSTETVEVTKIGKSKLMSGNLALTVKFANNSTETISVDPKTNLTVVEESLSTSNLDALMQGVDELNEAALEKLISTSLVEAYQNVAGFRLTNCAYLNEKFTVDGNIYFTSGKSRKTTYEFTEAYTENNKISLRGLNEKLGLDKRFILTGTANNTTKTFIVESFKQH